VVSPERTDGPEAKYFTHADSMVVAFGEFNATAFPRAAISSVPPLQPSVLGEDPQVPASPRTIDFGTAANQANIQIFNLGGSYVRPGQTPDPLLDVGYAWEATIEPVSSSPANPFALTLGTGFVTSTLSPDT